MTDSVTAPEDQGKGIDPAFMVQRVRRMIGRRVYDEHFYRCPICHHCSAPMGVDQAAAVGMARAHLASEHPELDVRVDDLDERHLLCLSILGHRTAPDGTLPADAVADLAELLWGGR